MTKDIHLLSISHSFLKKINTRLYSVLKKDYDIELSILIPKFHKDNNKVIESDFKDDEIDLNVVFQETYFNHLRLKIYKNLYKIIKKNRFSHIILDQDLISIQSIILIIYSYKFNYKLIYFSNENNIIEEKNLLIKISKKILYKLLNLLFKSRINTIICYTHQIKKNLDLCGFSKTTKVIPLGFDKNIFFNKKKQSSISKFTISYFGRLTEKKGILTLLKALDLIKIDKWIFQIDVHEIESLKFYKKIKRYLKKLKQNNKLRIIKPNYFDISKDMQNSHLTVIPSEWNEQYGRIIQESIACGSIVIGSDIGAIPEIITNKNFIFKPGDVNHLKEKIENIYYNYDKFKEDFQEIEFNVNNKRTLDFQAKSIYNLLNN